MSEALTDRLRAASEVAYEEDFCLLITRKELIDAAAEIERLTAEIERLRAASQRLNDEVDMYWNGCRTDAQVKRINEAQQSLRAAFQQNALNSEEGK